jgi:hypothetical protein
MTIQRRRQSASRLRRTLFLLAAAGCVLLPQAAASQGLTGALIGTVSDPQGAALVGAPVRISSPALIGGELTTKTNERGQLRFPSLPPGMYVLDIEVQGFQAYRELDIRIGAGATIERLPVLTLAGLAQSLVVDGTGSRIDARDPGFGTRFGPEDIKAIPTRRSSMFDFIRATPGISPTSPGSGTTTNGTTTTVSAFGSGTNENQFLIDGTNFTCPCNGVARSEPGVDFIQEIQVQSIGASVEYGNVQGAVINVITRQGGERFLYDASYYGQSDRLTSQPVRLPISNSNGRDSGYSRAKYRDVTTNLGGPVVADRLWFFAGYQHLRDYDTQPGSDPRFPRTYEQDKMLGKLTWRLAPGWQLVQSVHQEFWVNPDPPTAVTPFDATLRRSGSVPAITFGELTHTSSANTVWDVRVGRFVFTQEHTPSTGDRGIANRIDNVTNVASGAPQTFGGVTIERTTAKATMSHFQAGWLGADHLWKIGGQVERGGHHAINVIPTGVRFVDNGERPFRSVSSDPSHAGALFVTVAAFASDALTLGERLTISAGLRFDHTRAVSQDLSAVDLQGNETGETVQGLGTLYTWNLLSPRIGLVAKLAADGRTMLRASYGRFSQGVLTGELEPFHPGSSPVTTADFEGATGAYTRVVSVVNNAVNLRLDPETRAPRTDEYSIGVDREIGRRVAASIAYIHKDGANFIGWTEVGGQYLEQTRPLPDGRSVPVLALDTSVTPTSARRFLLTNPAEYSLTYNGLVMAVERRRSKGWQAFSSYTLSKAYGLLPSSGTSAAGAQVSTVSPPQPLTFGRDPNDLTNARGRLPNDRPHVFRTMGSIDIPGTGFVVAANLQYFSGKPWAATALVALPQTGNQPTQRVLLEPRGSQRLSSQTLLDLRVSRTFTLGGVGRIELLVDVLNALNDTAEEALATDNLFSATFGRPIVFMDPRRAMIGVRLNLGR